MSSRVQTEVEIRAGDVFQRVGMKRGLMRRVVAIHKGYVSYSTGGAGTADAACAPSSDGLVCRRASKSMTVHDKNEEATNLAAGGLLILYPIVDTEAPTVGFWSYQADQRMELSSHIYPPLASLARIFGHDSQDLKARSPGVQETGADSLPYTIPPGKVQGQTTGYTAGSIPAQPHWIMPAAINGHALGGPLETAGCDHPDDGIGRPRGRFRPPFEGTTDIRDVMTVISLTANRIGRGRDGESCPALTVPGRRDQQNPVGQAQAVRGKNAGSGTRRWVSP